MSTAPVPPPPETPIEQTPCPSCGNLNPLTAMRCRRCLAELGTQRAASVVSLPPPARSTRVSDAIRDRLTPRRVLLGLLLLVIAWQVVPRFLPRDAIDAPQGGRAAVSGPDGWGYLHGDATNAGVTSAVANVDGDVRWQIDLGVGVSSGAVADESAVYVALDDGRLVAIERDDGAVRWTREYGYTLTSAPTVADGQLYVLQRTGSVHALDVVDGSVVWEMPALGGYGVAPVVVDGSVYLLFGVDGEGDRSGAVVQLDAETGRELWRATTTQAFPARGIAVDATHVAVIGSQTVELYDRRYGERTFWFTFRYGVESIVLLDGVAYVSTSHEAGALSTDASRPWWDGVRGFWNNLYIHGMSPRPPVVPSVWLTRHDESSPLPAVVTANAIIDAGRDGAIRALEPATGATLWEVTESASITAPPILTGSGLLVAEGLTLRLLDPMSGAPIAQRDIEGGAAITQVIALTGGILVILEDGTVTALAP